MRKVIAQRLTASTQTVPHFYLTVDCNIGKLTAAREEINAQAPKDKDGKPAYKLSVNDFVIKALGLALQRIPNANVSWTEAGMLKHKHSDVGVAVAMPGGLITPIIRSAERFFCKRAKTFPDRSATAILVGPLFIEKIINGTNEIRTAINGINRVPIKNDHFRTTFRYSCFTTARNLFICSFNSFDEDVVQAWLYLLELG